MQIEATHELLMDGRKDLIYFSLDYVVHSDVRQLPHAVTHSNFCVGRDFRYMAFLGLRKECPAFSFMPATFNLQPCHWQKASQH
jgi:hypothetical protein